MLLFLNKDMYFFSHLPLQPCCWCYCVSGAILWVGHPCLRFFFFFFFSGPTVVWWDSRSDSLGPWNWAVVLLTWSTQRCCDRHRGGRADPPTMPQRHRCQCLRAQRGSSGEAGEINWSQRVKERTHRERKLLNTLSWIGIQTETEATSDR